VNSTQTPILRVRMRSAAVTRGVLALGGSHLPCALGKGGCRAIKHEGDGASPRGIWQLKTVYYRADRVSRPRTALPVHVLKPSAGWCDAPGDRNYNRSVRHPYPASAERMWRADRLYDIVIVLDHNDRPRRRGMGSAIFMHLARDGFTPTEGCIALRERDLRRVLAHIARGARIAIG
jgi:L,D-peptidoglycan transpeptidase YkuD (ErfK/YbiS/YcfS/YnhG family)